jgi:hypothetical protein
MEKRDPANRSVMYPFYQTLAVEFPYLFLQMGAQLEGGAGATKKE